MWQKIQKLFSPKIAPIIVEKQWRRGMWVIHQGKPAILVSLGDRCEIHYTHPITGETINSALVPIVELRQARYSEVPVHRQGISETSARELGYGP